jgi:hypothetical protein
MSKTKHKGRFTIGDHVASRVQPDFHGTIVGEGPNGLVVQWQNGFVLSESHSSLMPAGSVDTYTCEMLDRHYTCVIMRDGDSLVGGIDDHYAEIVTAELNTLAAEVARLREALVDAATALGAWEILVAFAGHPKPELHDAALTKAENALKHHTG